ncbi:MAG: hypothetical protein K0Q55_1204 [Verrucomicrobia bacterium]|jgi:hypothetical protein|nr:hypothetical protein [Verrucomicrobiota bacterium]
MKLEVVLSLLLLMMAEVSGALPLELQWRLALPQATDEKSEVLCSAHDHDGNLVLGLALTKPGPDAGVVSKVSPSGVELWRVEFPPVVSYYIRNIGTDAAGNIYFTTAANISGEAKIVLIKLSPAGQELWRCPMPGHPPLNRTHTLKISPEGTVWVTFLTNPPNSVAIEVKRVSAAGAVEWSVELPWNLGPGNDSFWPTEILDVDTAENVYITGTLIPSDLSTTSVLCKINANGQPAWTNRITPKYAGEIKVAANGKICVSGLGGYTVFSENGDIAGHAGVTGDYYMVKDATADGRFLLYRFGTSGGFLLLTGSDFPPVWQTDLGLEAPVQLARNPAGGWLSAGFNHAQESTTSQVRIFVQAFAEDGSRRWRQELPGVMNYLFGFSGYYFNLLMDVTGDGLRLTGNQAEVANQSSVIATSFSLPESLPPSFITAPLTNGIWSKGQTHTLIITPQGEGPFSYQWYYMGKPVPEQTAQTLSLTPASFPGARGYYYVEVTSGEETTASPVAEVKLDGIHLESLGLTSYGYHKMRAIGNTDARFLLQWSSDLVNWNDYNSTTNVSDLSFEAIPNSSSRFFRALKVE